MIFLPRPTAILEADITEDAANRLRAWFAALYSVRAQAGEVVMAIQAELHD